MASMDLNVMCGPWESCCIQCYAHIHRLVRAKRLRFFRKLKEASLNSMMMHGEL